MSYAVGYACFHLCDYSNSLGLLCLLFTPGICMPIMAFGPICEWDRGCEPAFFPTMFPHFIWFFSSMHRLVVLVFTDGLIFTPIFLVMWQPSGHGMLQHYDPNDIYRKNL